MGQVLLTGRSLGGGLAGYLGTTRGYQTVLFDNMTFGIAANTKVGEETGSDERSADFGVVRRYFTEHEFFAAVPAGDTQRLLDSYDLGYVLGLDGEAIGNGTQATESLIEPSIMLRGMAKGLSACGEYHSMALLAALLWADASDENRWRPADQQLWNAFFDASVAASIADLADATVENVGTPDNTLRQAIAYSALDIGIGERPFGDPAIWSMFDDAGDLGKVLGGSEAVIFGSSVYATPSLLHPAAVKDVKQYLADLIVQYAGALALYDVEQIAGGRSDTRQGLATRGEESSTWAKRC